VQLIEAQRATFYRDGYVIVPAALARTDIERTLTLINAELGRGLDAARIEEFFARSFCPELRNAPEILDLFRATPARWPSR
jgi:hypothetical protein